MGKVLGLREGPQKYKEALLRFATEAKFSPQKKYKKSQLKLFVNYLKNVQVVNKK